MKHLFILNPKAGKGKTLKLIPEIEKIFKERNDEYIIEITKGEGHASEIAKNYSSKEDYRIYSVGGDGTLNEVLNGMVESSSSLAVIPSGSGNDFIKSIYNYSEKENIGKLLRNTINLIRNSLDINEIKKHILNEVGKAFEADRCFIRILDREKGILLPVDKHSEYLSSPDIQSIVGLDPDKELHIYLKNKFLQDKAHIIPDCEKFKVENPNNLFIKLINKHRLKSDYGLAIFYSGKFMGILVVQYINKKVILNEPQLEFLKTIVDQTGTAIHQSQLYNLISQKAQRENLLRNISEKIRNSLDINEIKRTVVTETGKIFNSDRCIIREFI
jgi:hypothetical protein